MNRPTPFSTATLPILNLTRQSPLRRGFLLIPISIALTCFALSPTARAVDPPPDGGYPNNNTAVGTNALFSLTSGFSNTAIGSGALGGTTTGFNNTATGAAALGNNTEGHNNTAIGISSLFSNTVGHANTAIGSDALFANRTGNWNTAIGLNA